MLEDSAEKDLYSQFWKDLEGEQELLWHWDTAIY